MSPTQLGTIVKQRRKSLGLTQSDFCDIAEIAHHTLSDMESGRGNPTLKMLTKVLDVLGMELRIQVEKET